ncbi:serine/threonine-protein kinase [Hyphomonas sp.]|uniref:serine/threonine-protein kinase n=1 Tax=Hyphomonas sp. TaxID=87 RepID=UPI00391AC34D
MLKCRNCGAEMEAGDRFCTACGADQEAGLAGMMTIGGMETVGDLETRPGGLKPAPELAAGAEFAGRYTIQQVVGRGGMGVVYRAADRLAEKDIALKLIRADRLSGPAAVRRLIAEGITARDIRHKNIVAVYDAGEAEGQPFVSMEFLKGQSLRDWHREKIRQRKEIPLRMAARIVAEVLDGLAAAHAAGVIHRDLKPENIMLVEEPTETAAPLKILDFGIARAAGAALDSGTGTGLGTPRYMAPEQVTNPDTAGPPADLYSLSVIFYELLVDVLPQGHWQPPSGGRSDVPAGIDRLIELGLSNRPASRPRSAAEYRKMLVDGVNLTGPVKEDIRKDKDKDKDGTTTFSFDKKKLRLWGGIGLAVVAVMAILEAVREEGSSGPRPAPAPAPVYADDARAAEPRPSGSDFGPRIIPVNPPALSTLSGTWVDETGETFTMRMSNNGSFSGSGIHSVFGVPARISGRLNGAAGTISFSIPAANLTFNGRAQWDQTCHITYQLYDPMNNLMDQGRFHINHLPDEPCP